MMATDRAVRSNDDPSGLGAQAWERLLAALDPDPRRAAHSYEAVRKRLCDQFRWRGLAAPDELADEVLDRVARRLLEGEVPDNVVHYIAGVGRLLAFEAARGAQRFVPYRSGHIRLPAGDLDRDDAREVELRCRCLEHCLAELPANERELLLRYDQGPGSDRIAARRSLATSLGIPLNALRIRVHRIRARLEARVVECLGREPR